MVTVALLTPVVIANAGSYGFAYLAVIANNTDVTIQGTPIELDENGQGLGIATFPAEEGRRDYTVTVEHGPVAQEIPVTIIGQRPPYLAWWLFLFPLAALLCSVRIRIRRKDADNS
jgi:hypothetical protein